jgi:hypothetical protein
MSRVACAGRSGRVGEAGLAGRLAVVDLKKGSQEDRSGFLGDAAESAPLLTPRIAVTVMHGSLRKRV